MNFKPSIHGWAFEDRFVIEGPAVGLGSAAPRMSLGGGMCWAALDRYLDGRSVPGLSAPPEPGSPLHAELRRRQVAALDGVWARVRSWQGLPDGSWRDRLSVRLTAGRSDLASVTRREWPALRRSLDAGRPVLLTLVEPEDGYVQSTAARQVLAFGWAAEGARVVVSIYDPARPGADDLRLAFSLHGPLDGRVTGGQRIRAFFARPYDRAPAAALSTESFADRSVLGLNRKIRGRPGPTAGRGGLHVVARDGEGALLHFRRRKSRHWDGANITEREEFRSAELHSDPAPLAGPAGVGLHAFARSYVGDLLHFRLLRRWRVANRTEHRRAGPRFRLEGPPVPVDLPWGGACVVARGKEGALVAYSYVPLRGWRAEEVPAAGGSALAGDPTAVRIGREVHVIGCSRDGRTLHFERTSAGWSAGDLMTLCAGAQPVAEHPVHVVRDGRLHLFARTQDGALLHMERDDDGQWAASVVGDGISVGPTATRGPGGLHVFAPTDAGGLLHAWRSESGWRTEDLLETRPTVPAEAVPATGLVAWGSADELRVLGRHKGGGLVQWLWRRDADWTAGRVVDHAGVTSGHEPGEDPQLIRDFGDGFHLFATDGKGTVVHLEAGAWRAAAERATVGGVTPGVASVRPVSKRTLAEAGVPVADDHDAPPVEEVDPAPIEASTSGAKQASAEAPESPPLPLLPEPDADPEPDDLPLLEPMDLEELGTWPPKKPGRGGKPSPKAAPKDEPPWPEVG